MIHRRNRWVRMVHDAWSSATQAWWLEREAYAVGNATEMAEFEAAHPRPRYRDFLVEMAGCAA